MFAVGDAEQQISFLFSLLHNYHSETPIAAVEPPDLDVGVSHAMQGVLAMDHNRALAERMLTEASLHGMAAGAGSPAARAHATVELVYDVITKKADSSAYATAPPMGSEGRHALLAVLDKVGLNAREDPFPALETISCERRTNCSIFTTEGEPMSNPDGHTDFEVLRPAGDGGGLYSGSGRCYALMQTLKDTISGSVILARVVRVESTDANSVVLRWTEDCTISVKCVSKAWVVQKQQLSGEPMSENPLREIGCLAYLTRMMNGTVAEPEKVRGDPQRVLPMVDFLEDAEFYYMVRWCHF